LWGPGNRGPTAESMGQIPGRGQEDKGSERLGDHFHLSANFAWNLQFADSKRLTAAESASKPDSGTLSFLSSDLRNSRDPWGWGWGYVSHPSPLGYNTACLESASGR